MVWKRSMVSPGNLTALVARDRCVNSHTNWLVESWAADNSGSLRGNEANACATLSRRKRRCKKGKGTSNEGGHAIEIGNGCSGASVGQNDLLESIPRWGDKSARNRERARERSKASTRCLRKHECWLVNGIVQRPSLPFGEAVRDPAIPPYDRKGPTNDGDCASQACKTGVRWRGSYSEEQAKHLGVPVMPRNPFRDAMSHRVQANAAPYTSATSCGGILKDRSDNTWQRKRGYVVGARATAKKSCLLRYQRRWHEIAMLHVCLEAGANKHPASETLDRVGRAMRALHRLYSSFDPDGTDRVRYVDVLACLSITHKPDNQVFLERLQQTFLSNLGAISRELHAQLTKGNRQVAWRLLRRIFRLYDEAGGGFGLSLEEVERLFRFCASSDSDSLQMASTFTSYTQGHPWLSSVSQRKILTPDVFEHHFCIAWPVLDLFNVHMTACQGVVKRVMATQKGSQDGCRGSGTDAIVDRRMPSSDEADAQRGAAQMPKASRVSGPSYCDKMSA